MEKLFEVQPGEKPKRVIRPRDKFLISLSDNQTKIVSKNWIKRAEESAEKFDGFLGFTVIKKVNAYGN